MDFTIAKSLLLHSIQTEIYMTKQDAENNLCHFNEYNDEQTLDMYLSDIFCGQPINENDFDLETHELIKSISKNALENMYPNASENPILIRASKNYIISKYNTFMENTLRPLDP